LCLSVGRKFSNVIVPNVNFPLILKDRQEKLIVFSELHGNYVLLKNELFEHIVMNYWPNGKKVVMTWKEIFIVRRECKRVDILALF